MLNVLSLFALSTHLFPNIMGFHFHFDSKSNNEISFEKLYNQFENTLCEINEKVNSEHTNAENDKENLIEQLNKILCVIGYFLPPQYQKEYFSYLHDASIFDCYTMLRSANKRRDYDVFRTIFELDQPDYEKSGLFNITLKEKFKTQTESKITIINIENNTLSQLNSDTICSDSKKCSVYLPSFLLNIQNFKSTSFIFDYTVFSYLIKTKFDSHCSLTMKMLRDIITQFKALAFSRDATHVLRSKLAIIVLVSCILQNNNNEQTIRLLKTILFQHKSKEVSQLVLLVQRFYFLSSKDTSIVY